MAAVKQNLTVLQGETFRRQWTWKAGTPPTPVDLTGCTARMHVRATVAAPELLLDMGTTPGTSITLGGVDGTVVVEMTAAATAALAWQQAVYDLEIAHPGGQVRRLFAGRIAVKLEVTRA